MKMFTDYNAKNTFIIDKSNGYPVVVTSNVTKKTPWLNIFTNHGIEFANPKGESTVKEIDGKTYNWVPTNFYDRGLGGDYSNEEYKNVFLKLRFNGHIHDNSYFVILDRYVKKYKDDKEFRKKVNLYIELTEDLWKNKTKNIRFWFGIPIVVETDFGKKYYELENQLISIFKTI